MADQDKIKQIEDALKALVGLPGGRLSAPPPLDWETDPDLCKHVEKLNGK